MDRIVFAIAIIIAATVCMLVWNKIDKRRRAKKRHEVITAKIVRIAKSKRRKSKRVYPRNRGGRRKQKHVN